MEGRSVGVPLVLTSDVDLLHLCIFLDSCSPPKADLQEHLGKQCYKYTISTCYFQYLDISIDALINKDIKMQCIGT